MSEQVSPARLNLLRGAYLLTFAFLGFQVWPKIISGGQAWEPLEGVAVSFYAALSALCLLGARNPLAMLPLLVLQLFYKVVWLVAVWLPLRSAGAEPEMGIGQISLSALAGLFIVVAVADLVAIPWPYVVTRFVRTGGDGSTTSTPTTATPWNGGPPSTTRPSTSPTATGSTAPATAKVVSGRS
ncbi:MAG: hypothetical protein HYU28_07050 [Actinobacteria bacterium]|nr:hypothetical protein [Actinomycetota bacterium]